MNKMPVILAISLLLAFATVRHHGTAKQKGIAVVELFTSEGCSSCPSADAAVGRLLQKNADDVLILAYHVDYWDRLGWKDKFSSAKYSERQKKYAGVMHLKSIYTPQIVVNGTTEFVGSNEKRLSEEVQKGLENKSSSTLEVAVQKINNHVNVNYKTGDREEVLLNVALVQPEAITQVRAGENGGRTLHHVNIVRGFKSIIVKDGGKILLEVPEELSGIRLQLIVFTQDTKTLKVLAGEQKGI
jgi:hypothetical protein